MHAVVYITIALCSKCYTPSDGKTYKSAINEYTYIYIYQIWTPACFRHGELYQNILTENNNKINKLYISTFRYGYENYVPHWPDPTRPIATVRPIDLYAYLLITFASVTGCLKNKCFIRECLIYTENNFSRTSHSLNCVNFTITLSVTFCIIQDDPHRPT